MICTKTDCAENFNAECEKEGDMRIAVASGEKRQCYNADIRMEKKPRMIDGWALCVMCGAELPTESNRMICKECEEKANESKD